MTLRKLRNTVCGAAGSAAAAAAAAAVATAPAAVMAALPALLLSGCFSMSAVPPVEGLAPLTDNPPAASSFDAGAANAPLATHWGERTLMVRPTVNGRDVGWFLFDTGASAWTISKKAATRAELEAIGTTLIQGRDQTTVYECPELKLGALRQEHVRMAGLDMSNSSSAFGVEVAGICGQTLCRVAVVEVDAADQRLSIHDPSSWQPPTDVIWHPIEMMHGLPAVKCRYADGSEGYFVVDTGCDREVHFLTRAVKEHGAAPKEVTAHRTEMTFGSTRPIEVGPIDSLRVGDQALGLVKEAGFAIVPKGGADGSPDLGDANSSAKSAEREILPGVDGLLGMPLLKRFRLILDEPNDRMALVPKGL